MRWAIIVAANAGANHEEESTNRDGRQRTEIVAA
jgi:hypothetical protein